MLPETMAQVKGMISNDDLDETRMCEVLMPEDTGNEQISLLVECKHVFRMMERTHNKIQALPGDDETAMKQTLAAGWFKMFGQKF